MKARNINGTSDNDCRCGSWLQHWKNYGGNSSSPICSEANCRSFAEVGAHVQKEYDQKWWIIPLCKAHNNLYGRTIDVKPGTVFVSANKSETCG